MQTSLCISLSFDKSFGIGSGLRAQECVRTELESLLWFYFLLLSFSLSKAGTILSPSERDGNDTKLLFDLPNLRTSLKYCLRNISEIGYHRLLQ